MKMQYAKTKVSFQTAKISTDINSFSLEALMTFLKWIQIEMQYILGYRHLQNCVFEVYKKHFSSATAILISWKCHTSFESEKILD